MNRMTKLLLATVFALCACSTDIVRDRKDVSLMYLHADLPACAKNIRMREDNNPLGGWQMIRFDCPIDAARRFSSSLLRKPLRIGTNTTLGVHEIEGADWWIRSFPSNMESGSNVVDGVYVDVALLPSGQNTTVFLLIGGS